MTLIARLIKVVVTLATLMTSLETIARLARFAWSLTLELVRRQESAGRVVKGWRPKFAWGK